MKNCLIFEDGNLVHNSIHGDVLWAGLFSKVEVNGSLIKFISSFLKEKENTILVIPKSDGNVNNKTDNHYHDVNWMEQIAPLLEEAKNKNKTFILGVLCQVNKEEGINYLYLPLDDGFFEKGIRYYFSKEQNTYVNWQNRSSDLCWRGGCSGIGGSESIRVNFVKKIYDYQKETNVRLSKWWSENKNIPEKYFADRIYFDEFLKYKIFFIVDGNCIASNHMYGFASGCIPFLISNAKCWFNEFIIPNVHYIPIEYDLSNLIEKIEWVKENDAEAEKIANNAYEFAMNYFSSEYQEKYLINKINSFINCP